MSSAGSEFLKFVCKKLTSVCFRVPPSFSFHFLDNKLETDGRLTIQLDCKVLSEPHPFSARMVSNRRLTEPTHFQDVRLIEFDISGSSLEYVPVLVLLRSEQGSWV